ncbi:MAG: hypothetical protein IJV80_04130 [Clostridia bacterium]|nr:hypothetical protein [Clostridia bacterium]
MKKLFLLLITLSVCLYSCVFPLKTAFCARQVRAETPSAYACVLTDGVYFYASDDVHTELFLLPKTYFVKVLHKGTEFTKVEYQTDGEYTKKLIGYCKSADITPVDFTPNVPYLTATFNVEYSVNGGSPDDPFLTPVTMRCTYYGSYYVGSKTYCYVLRENDFAYVPLPSGFTYEENTEYESRLPKAPVSTSTETTGGSGGVQIAAIVVICLLVLVLAALVVKPNKKSPYDREE